MGRVGRVAYLVLRGDVGTTVDPAVVLGYVCTDACELTTVIKYCWLVILNL